MIGIALMAVGLSMGLYMVDLRWPSTRLSRWAYSALGVASAAVVLELGLRGIIGHQWPLGTVYEFSLGFAVTVGLAHLAISFRARANGAGAAFIVLGILGYSALMPASMRAITTLAPVLRSAWLQGHVLAAMAGYGCFGAASGFALIAVFVPSERRALLSMMRHAVELGVPWLSLGLLAGAMWARNAWGRYWGWDIKETWAFITWLWHLTLLHRARQREGAFPWLVLVGFGLVIFTLAFVPAMSRWLSLDTLHGY